MLYHEGMTGVVHTCWKFRLVHSQRAGKAQHSFEKPLGARANFPNSFSPERDPPAETIRIHDQLHRYEDQVRQGAPEHQRTATALAIGKPEKFHRE